MLTKYIFLLLVFLTTLMSGQNTNEKKFNTINSQKNWRLELNDNCSKDWNKNWFLDGYRATVKNTDKGILFSGGPTDGDDACHAVLWTKESFSGDVKIEYDYTRTDTRTAWVNILYIQATGVAPFDKDISKWNDYRIIPYMRSYFNHMKAIHISFSAYNKDNTDLNNDYIRVRRYPRSDKQQFSLTEVPPSSFKTGLFKPGEKYKITVIKKGLDLYFKVEGKAVTKLFSWKLTQEQAIQEGRIGLRHMYTRSAIYDNFKVYIKR